MDEIYYNSGGNLNKNTYLLSYGQCALESSSQIMIMKDCSICCMNVRLSNVSTNGYRIFILRVNGKDTYAKVKLAEGISEVTYSGAISVKSGDYISVLHKGYTFSRSQCFITLFKCYK